jgi:malate synthase
MKLKAVIFDAYGTLFDVYSVSALAEQLFPGKGEALAALWRDKQIDYTRIYTLSGKYDSFWNLTRAGLRYAAARLKLGLSANAETQLMNAYSHLSTFPENKAVLEALKARGVPMGILSNGNREMLDVAVKSAGLDTLIDHVISVDAAGKFKTAPEAYALGPQAMKLSAQEILFVSSNSWDVMGATWYGYTTLWVNRTSAPFDDLDAVPSFMGATLNDVLTKFDVVKKENSMCVALPSGMNISGVITPEYAEILTPDALALVVKLHRAFEVRRQELLAARVVRTQQLDAGMRPDFLPETKAIRDGAWSIAPLPPALHRRRVEITGPVEAKMIINAFNSGADSYMTDFEDSNSPKWDNQIQGQINLKAAVRRTLALESNGKSYKLNDNIATLQVRPRGWHLDEKHVTVDGQRVSGGIFDFALFLFHNAKEQLARGAGPYFYLPKIESHLEARLWNDIFVMAQEHIGLPQGTIKATVLIETILAAFEMDEILYELREHSAGLNAGRWDYIFSCIKKFKLDGDFCLADRVKITMNTPFMRAYALLLIKTCHHRGAPAIGGMSALIPIKNDPEKNAIAMGGIIADKRRDATDGYDGGWVAHPGLVEASMKEFVEVLGDKPNQLDRQKPYLTVTAEQLLEFQPEAPITEHGLRMNINVGIHYLGAWLAGNGCVPIHNLMEDAATAEISRSQVWQWIRSTKGVLDDGRKVTADLVRGLIAEELAKIKAGGYNGKFDRGAEIFEKMSTQDKFEEFLTLPLYEEQSF